MHAGTTRTGTKGTTRTMTKEWFIVSIYYVSFSLTGKSNTLNTFIYIYI